MINRLQDQMKNHGFNTRAIHGETSRPDNHRAIRYPIYAGVAYDFESAEDIEHAFSGEKPAHAYSRSSNPTVEAFERKITSLEGGHGTVALASGMAAISNIVFNLLEKGDNLLASPYLFGNTYSLFKHTLSKLGIETRFVDISRPEAMRAAMDDRSRLLFFETISNPQMVVPDIRQVSKVAHAGGLAVVADATVTTPRLFNAGEFDIDVVVHSTTKYISGGATSVGGVIVDMGQADWTRFPSLANHHEAGRNAFINRLRKEVYRNFGSCMSPQSAHLQSLGLETLSLRIERSSSNAIELASFLEQHSLVKAVFYPGLTSSPYFELARDQFRGHFGGILGFELTDRKTCYAFLNALQLIRRATNLNDNCSLIIHPASTIYADFSPEEKREVNVSEGLIRLSVGIEDVEDLQHDLEQALDAIR